MRTTAEEVRRSGEGVLAVGMHDAPVITIGRHADARGVFVDPADPRPVIRTERGGAATAHGPGQLIVYPIWPVRAWRIGVRDHACALLSAAADTLRAFGIETHRDDARPGLYTADGAKIASIGFRVQDGVSIHGLSLNVRGATTLFGGLHACGERAPRIAEMADFGVRADLGNIAGMLAGNLAKHASVDLSWEPGWIDDKDVGCEEHDT